jgi:hypothetical protein
LLGLVALGCGSEPETLGQSPEILWWTDHETTDFTDWERDGKGSTWSAFNGRIEIVEGPARSGSHAARASVASAGPGFPSAGIAVRADALPSAHYSAWYYLPASPSTLTYWVFFKFRSRRTATDPLSAVEVWDLDFVMGPASVLELSLLRHGVGNELPRTKLPIPIERWFQIEAFLSAANDSSGRLSIWQDGILVFDVAGPTMPSSHVEWNVGSVAELIAPPNSLLYVDDAAISTERLGPNYPIFWRAN